MRLPFLVSALFVTACGEQDASVATNQPPGAAAAQSATQTFAGQGRDRLCLDERGGRAGLITYGESDANCSIRGAVQRTGERITIAPDGDQSCQVAGTVAGNRVRLGSRTPECAYYCGPTADFSGRSFRAAEGGPVTDLAGDPLC